MSCAARLNRLWRLLATALSFALFGAGGLLISLLWFWLLVLIPRQQTRKRLARRSIWLSFRLFLFIVRHLGVLDFQIRGGALLQADRGCLIVANHPTLLDYVLLVSQMPATDCLVKSDLLRNPFVGGVIRAADYLLNSQPQTLLPLCQQRLAAGETILIFPEGTRTPLDQPRQLQRGAANIAVRCQCDVRLVTIYCSQPMLDKTHHWYQVPPFKPLFHIEVGERINIHDFSDGAVPSLAARRLNQQLAAKLKHPTKSLAGTVNERALSGN